MFVAPFGHMSHEARDAPDAAELAEEVILSMIERSKGCSVDTGDVACSPGPRTGRVAGGL